MRHLSISEKWRRLYGKIYLCTLAVPGKMFWIMAVLYIKQLQITNKHYLTSPYLTTLASPSLTPPGATFPSPQPIKLTTFYTWCQTTSKKVTKIWQNKFLDRLSTLVPIYLTCYVSQVWLRNNLFSLNWSLRYSYLKVLVVSSR